jgi:hypothetical protein
MMMFSKKNLFISLGLAFFITGCNNAKTLELTSQNNIINKQSSLQIRDIQIRTFDNTTKENLSKAIIDTLLDDDYFITLIDINAGVISAKTKKDALELNLVSIIKEVSENSYSVRFSITAVDEEFNSYTIIDDDLIYRYIFDKLRKSLFLEKNLYNKTQNIEMQKSENIQKIDDTLKIDKIVENTVPTFPIIKQNKKEYKTRNIGKYTLQFVSAKDKTSAISDFNQLKKEGYEVRLESLKNYYVVRLGLFKNPNEGAELLNKLRINHPEVLMIKLR